MEKAFWGMVAGCTLAFGILLAVYLNKTGAIDLANNQEEETQTQTETETESNPSADIAALLEETQGNYAAAMKAMEDEENSSADTLRIKHLILTMVL